MRSQGVFSRKRWGSLAPRCLAARHYKNSNGRYKNSNGLHRDWAANTLEIAVTAPLSELVPPITPKHVRENSPHSGAASRYRRFFAQASRQPPGRKVPTLTLFRHRPAICPFPILVCDPSLHPVVTPRGRVGPLGPSRLLPVHTCLRRRYASQTVSRNLPPLLAA